MKVTAVNCVKNEGPFLLEWIAFNQVIGVTDFLFYSNACDDGTDTLLDTLARAGVVHHLPNPAKGRKYQVEALRDCRSQPVVKQADYVWIADVDEFLNIKLEAGTVSALVEACGTPDAISVSHQNFANCGIADFVDEPLIGQFTRSHNPDLFCDRLDIEVKTLLRPDFPTPSFRVHRPFLHPDLQRRDWPNWTDGSGRRVPRRFMANAGDGRRLGFSARGAREFASLNHYALRSLDSYLVNSDRGDNDAPSFDDSSWRERNDDAFEDLSIQRFLEPTRQRIAELKTLKGVAAGHTTCVERHIAKIKTLRADPDFEKLRDKLIGAPHIPPAELQIIDWLENGFPAA